MDNHFNWENEGGSIGRVDEQTTQGMQELIDRGCTCTWRCEKVQGIWALTYVDEDCPIHGEVFED